MGMTGDERPERVDQEVDEELAFHIEQRAAELVERGWSESEARAHARATFGDLERIRSESRRLRRTGRARRSRRAAFEALAQDLRLGLHSLRRDRGLSTLVVLTLALGIGFATALFGVVDGVLLRPLPYATPERLVYLWQNDRATGTTREAMGSADFYDFRDRTRSFEAVAMWGRYEASMQREGGDPVQLRLAVVHHDLDDLLGLTPVLGRGVTIDETEGAGGDVIVLGDALWRSAFDGDPAVVGTDILLDGVPTRVVGVLPPRASLLMGGDVDAWRPLRMTSAQATRNPHAYRAVARLAPGVAVAAAQADAERLAAELEAEDPANTNRGAFVEPLDAFLRGDARGTLLALVAAVGVLLALATLNVTNLLLARAAAREGDAAVHTALGSGTGRTIRRQLAATIALSLTASVVGALFAWGALGALGGLIPPDLRALGAPRLDARVLGFAVTLALLLAVAFGVGPALAAARVDPARSLGSAGRSGAGARRATFTRRLLVGGQAALATLLLVGAGLLGLTVQNLGQVELGFATERVLRGSVALPTNRYPVDFSIYPHLTERLEFTRESLRRLGEVPGVEAVALVTNHSLDPGFTNSIAIEGQPPDPARGEPTTRMVTPGYRTVAGVRLLDGRWFEPGDVADAAGVVVLNRVAAERYFPDGDALGQRIAFWGLGFREIVGIVQDERVGGPRTDPPPAFYTSLLQTPPAGGTLTFMIRTAGDPRSAAPALRRIVREIDPQLAVFDIATMDETLALAQQRERFVTALLGAFATMALALAAIGVYGVLSYSVARRTRELGIRKALGADRGGVRRLVLAQGAGLVAGGIAIGLAAGRLGARTLESLLFGVDAGSPLPYLVAGTALLAVAFVASLVPAMRASSVAPAHALRSD